MQQEILKCRIIMQAQFCVPWGFPKSKIAVADFHLSEVEQITRNGYNSILGLGFDNCLHGHF